MSGILSKSPCLLLSLALMACSGGGGGSSAGTLPTGTPTTPNPTPNPNPGPGPNPTPTPAPTGVTVASVNPVESLNDRASSIDLLGSGFSGLQSLSLADPANTPLSFTINNDQSVTAQIPEAVSTGSHALVLNGVASAVTVTLLNLTDPAVAGAFAQAHLDASITGASGDTPAARIYYPGQSAGAGAAVDARRAPYPVIIYNHGFKPPLFAAGIDYRNNEFAAMHLASFGYIVVCVDLATNNVLTGSNATAQANTERDAADARAALDFLELINNDPQHLLNGSIDVSRSGLAGHSRGAGSTFLAAAEETRLLGSAARFKALAAMAPVFEDSQNNNLPLQTGDFSGTPALIIGATEDRISPFAQQVLFYGNAGPSSMIFEIVGGNHSQYKDSADVLFTDGNASLSLAEQQAICQRTLVSWFETHLRGRASAFRAYINQGSVMTADPRVQSLASK